MENDNITGRGAFASPAEEPASQRDQDRRNNARIDKKEKIRAYKERRLEGGVFAIRNTKNGRLLLSWTTELQGSKNRFQFAQMTGSCTDRKIARDWDAMGREVFVFEVLDSLTQKENQTSEEFKEDVRALYELWLEKTSPELLY